MLSLRDASDGDAVRLKNLPKRHRRVGGRVVDGNFFGFGWCVGRDRPVDMQDARAGIALNLEACDRLCGARLHLGHDHVERDAVLIERYDGWAIDCAGRDRQLQFVVGDGEGGDGRAVVADDVFEFPVADVRLVGEEGVVTNDAAGDGFDAFGGELCGEVFEVVEGERWRGLRRVRVVGEIAGIQIGVASADQREIPLDNAGCGGELAGDTGFEDVGWAEDGERGGGRQQLVIARRAKQLRGVELADGCAVEGGDRDPPVRGRSRRERLNLRAQRAWLRVSEGRSISEKQKRSHEASVPNRAASRSRSKSGTQRTER